MGYFFFAEPLYNRVILGGLLIIGSIIGVSMLQRKINTEDEQ
jgi:drug/metabolite transporter (DMT)-like permease